MFGPVGSIGIGGEIARAYTHGYAQGLISEFTGGDFMTGFASGGLSSLAGSSFLMYGGKFANSTLGTYSFSGLAGGVGAELTGGDFFQGAAIGIMNAGLNHLQSMVDEAGARYIANKKLRTTICGIIPLKMELPSGKSLLGNLKMEVPLFYPLMKIHLITA